MSRRSAVRNLCGQEWFDRNQAPLLFLANTRAGRRMLRIENDVPKGRSIVRVRPNGFDCLDEHHPTFLHALWSMQPRSRRGKPVQIISDFRCRPKIANRLARSWVPNVLGWNQYVGEVWDQVGSPFRVQSAFAATLTVYPDPNPETVSVDGHVYQSEAGGVSWATIIAAAGSVAVDGGTPTTTTYIDSHTTSNTWNYLTRSICLFDTSAIGTDNNVDSAILSLYGVAKVDGLSITPNVNIYSSAPATNTAVVAGDYDSLGSTEYSTSMSYASWTLSAYNDFTLNASGIAAVSKTSITKLGVRNANYDVAAIQPTWGSGLTSYLTNESAESAGTTADPKLVVTYSAASTFKPIVIAV